MQIKPIMRTIRNYAIGTALVASSGYGIKSCSDNRKASILSNVENIVRYNTEAEDTVEKDRFISEACEFTDSVVNPWNHSNKRLNDYFIKMYLYTGKNSDEGCSLSCGERQQLKSILNSSTNSDTPYDQHYQNAMNYGTGIY